MSKTPTLAQPDLTPAQRGDADALARAMANGYTRYVAFLQREYDLARADAIDRAGGDVRSDAERLADLRERAPDQVQWYDLQRLVDVDRDAVMDKWAEMKEQARDNFESGHLAAEVLAQADPWPRARFLAVRQSFVDEWKPRGGVERAIIDQMAQCHMQWLVWLEDFHYRQWAHTKHREDKGYHGERYELPRLSQVEYVERALDTAERFQRMFLACVRSLRDLRRLTGRVTIQNAGPLSVGGNQQVNVECGEEW